MERLKTLIKNCYGWVVKKWPLIKTLLIVLVSLLALYIVYAFIGVFFFGGRWESWTGFGPYIDADGKQQPAKTLWEWMQLLIIPLVLALGAFWLERGERKSDRQIAEDRYKHDREISQDQQREAALQAYFDKMTEMLLDKDHPLRKSKPGDEERVVARTRTLATLRTLDPERKRFLVNFLYEADLIIKTGDSSQGTKEYDPIVNMMEADLTDTNLGFSNLKKVNLRFTNLIKTNFFMTDLGESDLRNAFLVLSDLRYANLTRANLSSAILREADLSDANLSEANLRWADLRGADLRWANLTYTDLRGAKISKEQLASCASMEGAILKDIQSPDEEDQKNSISEKNAKII
jgi:hypothetical protein